MESPLSHSRLESASRSPKIAARRNRIRDALLRGSAELIADKGVAAVSVEEIIDQAGISRRTFYSFFANKYELVGSVLNPVLDSGTKRLTQLARQDASALLPGIVDCYLALWDEQRNAVSMITSVNTEVLPYIEKGHRKFGAALRKVLRIAEPSGQLRNSSAGDTFKVITRTAVPLLKIYGDHPNGRALYRDSMLALLRSPDTGK
jgi:AcrR family transcriptional regulator